MVQVSDSTRKMPLDYGKKSIRIFTGPMFSGKTTALINGLNSAKRDGKKCIAIKPDKDRRYAFYAIVAHGPNGKSFPSHPIRNAAGLKNLIYTERPNVIGIDEFQFFEDPKDIFMICRSEACDRREVFIAGLNTDFLARKFEWIDCLTASDKVSLLIASCVLCGSDASFTKRTELGAKIKERIAIGAEELYEPVCSTCHPSFEQDR